MPLVYGSSSNLLSITKKKNTLLPRKLCKYPHCSPALFSLQKRNSLEPKRHWVASTHSILTPPSSQIVAFKQWPFLFVKASLLFWVGFPCRLFCVSSRVALRRSRCRHSRSRWDTQGEHPELLTPALLLLAVTMGRAFPIFTWMAKTRQLLITATNYKILATVGANRLVRVEL